MSWWKRDGISEENTYMAVSENGKYSGRYVYDLLETIKGKTLGEIDTSGQFSRTDKSDKITGIAGDVIEQSVFGYGRDSRQECDIQIDGLLTELKTTGVRVPKKDLEKAKSKTGDEYYRFFEAKEGISVTRVTFEPDLEYVFEESHFWEKSQHMLIVFYEYEGYDVVPASAYSKFRVVGYCYNTFSEHEKATLRSDWEIVRNYLDKVYSLHNDQNERYEELIGFTHVLRPRLLFIELVPGLKKRSSGSYQKPRYRLKKTFVDTIIKGHFDKTRANQEVKLLNSFTSFEELDRRCHVITEKYGGKTLSELKDELGITTSIRTKDFTAKCVIEMFGADCRNLNQIVDFTQAGIIAKTVTVSSEWRKTEDTKLFLIDFLEWANRDVDFEDSEVYRYFCEHSFLCPIFLERDSKDSAKTTFKGFKRFSFDDEFINGEVYRTWKDSRNLIFRNELVWETRMKDGRPVLNKSGSVAGAPNFPKSKDYKVFFRGGSTTSADSCRTEEVNSIRMLPQYIWLHGTFLIDRLREMPYL